MTDTKATLGRQNDTDLMASQPGCTEAYTRTHPKTIKALRDAPDGNATTHPAKQFRSAKDWQRPL